MKNNPGILLKFLSSIVIFTVMIAGISIFNLSLTETTDLDMGSVFKTHRQLTGRIGISPVQKVYAADKNSEKSKDKNKENFKNPFTGLHSALLGDPDTGEIYFAESIDDSVPMASLTKLMTYLLVKEAIDRGDIKADEKVTISKEAENVTYLYGKLWLKEGDKVPLNDLMNAMLVVSSNESAVALACHVAGSERTFADMMNKRAKELGLKSTFFYNSSGLPNEDMSLADRKAAENLVNIGEDKTEDVESQNRMSSRDLFVLGSYILRKYPEVTKISSMKKISIDQFNFEDENTNSLLKKFKSVDGMKTGYTDSAGRCIMISQTETFMGRKKRMIGIVLGADTVKERNKDAEILYHMGKTNIESSILYNTHGLFVASIPDKESMTGADQKQETKGISDRFNEQKFVFKVIELGIAGILVFIVAITMMIRVFRRKRRRPRNIMGGRRRRKRRKTW